MSPSSRSMLPILLVLAAACSALPGRSDDLPRRGVVAAPEPIAASIGAEVLHRGGNAVDAAVAVGFVLAVTLPSAGNIGGGGFLLVHHEGKASVIDYRETAPAAASPEMYLDGDGEVVPGRSIYGALAAGVPGTVRGLWEAHRRYGSRPWAELLQPAIRLAEDGWLLDERRAHRFAAMAERTDPRGLNFSRYFRGKPGDRFRQPELAGTLRRIARDGPAGFYEGPTAERIVAEMERGGGRITLSDLRAYRAVVRDPVRARIGALEIVSMPPPSSGGVALIQMMRLLAERDLPPAGSAEYVHVVAEIEKRVFADRARHLGDPDHVPVPVDALISAPYLARRGRGISPDRRTPSSEVTWGSPESEETTHFSIVDGRGGAVANTYTLNGGFGSGVVVEGAGFLLNNEMDDFSAKPGAPNLYGVTGGEANAIAPGKRMLSSMTPTFVYRNGELWLVLGTPGGPTIFTTVFQVIVNRAWFGMSLAQAVEAPRFHHQWPPPEGDPISIERGREPADAVRASLEALGYTLRPRSPIGDVQAIELGAGGPIGVSDPRGLGRTATTGE